MIAARFGPTTPKEFGAKHQTCPHSVEFRGHHIELSTELEFRGHHAELSTELGMVSPEPRFGGTSWSWHAQTMQRRLTDVKNGSWPLFLPSVRA
jgi:hypothetical protein